MVVQLVMVAKQSTAVVLAVADVIAVAGLVMVVVKINTVFLLLVGCHWWCLLMVKYATLMV